MTLNYELAVEDYKEVANIRVRSSFIMFYGSWFLALVLCLIGGVSFFEKGLLFPPTLLFGGAGLYLIYSFTIARDMKIKRSYKKHKSEPVTVKIDEKGIWMASSTAESVLKWDYFSWFSQTQNLFLLFRGTSLSIILPKRAFANEADLEQFRAWASSIGQKDAPPIAPIPQP